MDKFILLLKYIVVAIVQGIAEILPISSSGHMIVVQKLLNLKASDLTFEIFLHFASLIAIIFFFRKKLIKLIKHFFIYIFNNKQIKTNLNHIDEKIKNDAIDIKNNFKIALYIIIATIPAAIAGYLLESIIADYFTKIWVIGICLLFTSAILYVSTKIKRNKKIADLKWHNALFIGLFQCLGIIPGVSRSGSCLVGGASQKVEQGDAAEFAFLLAIPIMLGSAIFKIGDITTALSDKSLIIPYIVAFLITLFTTYFAIKLFLNIIRRQKLTVFAVYCFFAGLLFIVGDLIF